MPAKNLGWLFGTLLNASLFSLHIALSPASAVGVLGDFPFGLSCGVSTDLIVPTWATNHCVNTACPSNSFLVRSSILLLRAEALLRPPCCSARQRRRSCCPLSEIALGPRLCRACLSWHLSHPRCSRCSVLDYSAVSMFLHPFENDSADSSVVETLHLSEFGCETVDAGLEQTRCGLECCRASGLV